LEVFDIESIRAYYLKDILFGHRNIVTRIVITKEKKEGNALLYLRRAFLPIEESPSLH